MCYSISLGWSRGDINDIMCENEYSVYNLLVSHFFVVECYKHKDCCEAMHGNFTAYISEPHNLATMT